MEFLLGGLLVIASCCDLKYRRIPNWLIGGGLLIALSLHFISGGWTGVWFSLTGLAAGIGLLLIPFAARGIGAGDVKLLGMVGAFQGLYFVFSTFLWMALWGGLMALYLAYRNGKLGQVLFNLIPASVKYTRPFTFTNRISGKESSEPVVYPYALAIALGVLCTFLKGWC